MKTKKIKFTTKTILVVLLLANSYNLSASDSLYVNGSIKTIGACYFTNNGNILISGNLNNAATLASGASSTIRFWGTTTTQVITSSSTTFQNATIDNTQGVSLSSGNISINGILTLKHGIFTTGSNIIDLGSSSGSIVETAIAPTSYVTGKVKATRNIGSGTTDQSFGGIGLIINESTLTTNSTEVIRTTGSSCTNGANLGIKRYYDITPTTATGLNATIKFYYFNHELDVTNAGVAIVENNMIFYKSTNSGSTWSGQLPTSSNTATDNWYAKTVIPLPSLSRWTLADMSKPLPVELLSFSSYCENNNIGLKWATASETNNNYFTVERTNNKDVSNFVPVGTVNGHGNSNTVLNYQFTDNLEMEKCSDAYPFYYRIKQTDYDGKYSYSNIIPAHCCGNTKIPVLSPNPSDGNITGYVYDGVREINVTIINSFGQKVLSEKYLLNNTNTFLINATGMENGMYIINLKIDSKIYTYRQIILKN